MKYIAQAFARIGSEQSRSMARILSENKYKSSIQARNNRPPFGIGESVLLRSGSTVFMHNHGTDVHYTAFGDDREALIALFYQVGIGGDSLLIDTWRQD